MLKRKETLEVCTSWSMETQGRNSVVFKSKKGSNCVSSCNCLFRPPDMLTSTVITRQQPVKQKLGLLLVCYPFTSSLLINTQTLVTVQNTLPHPTILHPNTPHNPDRISGSTSCAVEFNGSGWSPSVALPLSVISCQKQTGVCVPEVSVPLSVELEFTCRGQGSGGLAPPLHPESPLPFFSQQDVWDSHYVRACEHLCLG